MNGLKSLLSFIAIAILALSPAAQNPASKLQNKKSLKERMQERKTRDTVSYEEFAKRAESNFAAKKKEMEKRFVEYRDSVMKSFVAALDNKWVEKDADKAMPKPIDNSIGPQIDDQDLYDKSEPEKPIEDAIKDINPDPKEIVTPKTEPKKDVAPKQAVKKETAPKTEPKKDVAPKQAVKKETAPKTEPKKDVAPKQAVNKEAAPKAEPKKEVVPKAEPKKEAAPKTEPKKDVKPRETVDLAKVGKLPIKEIVEIPSISTNIQPKPFVPVVIPEDVDIDTKFKFTLFGTDMQVAIDDDCKVTMPSQDNRGVAKAIEKITGNDKYGVVLQDCLNLRDEYRLCDWAYLLALTELGNAFYGGECNDATLLTGYLFCMSGYKMRFAFDGNKKLYLLVASEQYITNMPSVPISTDGNRRYYVIGAPNENGMQISFCDFAMPKERALSLWIKEEPKFADVSSPLRQRLANYPTIKFDYKVNRNLLRFYDTYPTPFTEGDMMSKWTYYAQAPMSANAQATVYPALRAAIAGKTQLQAVNILMDFIESFKYGYDDKIWGYDRAFFPDETIYYPYSDCEDHAILLTRLVRDLLGLETALIYYPGHLASAVCFTESVAGDYFNVSGKKFTVCDATIYYSGAGRTMKGMDNKQATVILVK